MTDGLLSTASMSSMRPPMLAGPIDRHLNVFSTGSSDWLTGGAAGAACPPRPWARTGPAISATVRHTRSARSLDVIGRILMKVSEDTKSRLVRGLRRSKSGCLLGRENGGKTGTGVFSEG